MFSKEDIFNEMKKMLVETFEIEEKEISLGAKLFEDLDLDSIDAIDLIRYLQKLTGIKVAPEEFKKARTIADSVEIVDTLIKARG